MTDLRDLEIELLQREQSAAGGTERIALDSQRTCPNVLAKAALPRATATPTGGGGSLDMALVIYDARRAAMCDWAPKALMIYAEHAQRGSPSGRTDQGEEIESSAKVRRKLKRPAASSSGSRHSSGIQRSRLPISTRTPGSTSMRPSGSGACPPSGCRSATRGSPKRYTGMASGSTEKQRRWFGDSSLRRSAVVYNCVLRAAQLTTRLRDDDRKESR